MTTPAPGFAVEVGELERHAAELPQVAAAMRKPLSILREHTASPRPQEVAAVSAVEHEYGTFTEDLANRQSRAADLVDATALALHDIAQVYRRVDGQG
ncbi:hypothetical protein [Actinophytocola oryzae]|uniref:PE family protein n=1 Tax=Actinophytocola oryzae TaxID=502181 RepID=A0A4R7VB15_9PSEU|nr:hypothetical protein [Actinophytocola oryzae]TDV46204.1 hypothetical protein CLV71_111162 [Actinophytocola oryzae]